VMQVPAGLAADRLGPRRTLAIGLALMAAGELAFAVATTMPVALGGRALVGIGDACIFLNVLRIGQNWFPARRYALLASLAGIAGAAGQVVTTIPLGAALGVLGWTTTFAASGVLTAALVVACLVVVRDRPAGGGTPVTPPDHEPIGRTLRHAWATPATRQGFWVHVGLMGTFVTITALWGYPYLVRAQGLSPGSARAQLLLCVVAFAVGAPLAGALVARRPGVRSQGLAGLGAALAALWAVVLAWPGVVAPMPLVTAALLLTGLCGGAGLVAFDLAREGNPPGRAGAASGLVNTGGFLAAVAGQLLIGALLETGGDAAFDRALWPMVGIAALGAANAARHGRRRTRAGRAHPPLDGRPRPVAGLSPSG
jgi:MFS family permease